MGWKTAVRATLALSVFALLTGCSGGGDGGNDGPAAPTATGQISGTVSGTTVIAVNDNGDIISRDDTTGKLPDGDGHFPFLLIEIPVGENIRIFLIIEGNIIPLYFDTDGDSLADTNVFALNSAIRIGLGFVGTAVEGEEGRAIPQNNPTDNPDVTGGLVDTSIPASLTEPDTSGLSLSALLTNGFDTLAQGMVLSARAYFREAADVTGSSTSNDADTARFFFTLTRLAALAFDAYSDGTPSDMNRLGDILDRFGCGSSDVQRSNLDAIVLSCTEFLPDNSPTGGDLQDFLYNVVRPELDGAVSDLDNISLSFNTSWVEPFDRQTVESDYGDVLFLRAIIKGILAAIAGQMAYDLEDDIDEAVNNVKTVERLLEDNQELFTIFDTSKLIESRAYLESGAIDDLGNAIDWMRSETDNQTDDLINLLDNTPEELVEAQNNIDTAKVCLDEPCVVDDNDTLLNPNDDSIIDLSNFWSGMDLGDLLPPFTDNDPSGFFPDPSLGETIVSGIDINEDTSPADDIPDIIQDLY